MTTDNPSEILRERLAKIEALKQAGAELYGQRFLPIEPIQSVRDNFQEARLVRIAGRMSARRDHGKSCFIDLKDESNRIQVYVKKDVVGDERYAFFQKLDLGDILGLEGELFTSRTGELSVKATKLELLSKIVEVLPEKWHGLKDVEIRYRRRYLDLIANEPAREVFRKRSRIIRRMREMLDEKGFMEVETPMMQPIPGGAKAEPFITHHNTLDMDLYLRIAPELYLKRLLVGGFEKVYEINRNFRNEGISIKHNPEFTMMELYWAYADYTDMMALTEEVVHRLVVELHGKEEIAFGEKTLNFKRPWKRISFYGSLKEKTGVDWQTCDVKAEAKKLGVRLEDHFNTADILNEVFSEKVEPELNDPTFVIDYPLFMSPLAKQKPGHPDLVDRFELFVSQMELANAYSELNDPFEQRRRFETQMSETGSDKKMDEDFVRALECAMPPAGGLGIGIDRLVMLLTDSHSIRDVILFPQLRPEVSAPSDPASEEA